MNSDRRTWNLVIADDNPDDRAEVRRLLLLGAERRYQFTDVETGAATLRAVLEPHGEAPVCLILDFHLPDADALDIIHALLGSRGIPVCPIVVITGSASSHIGTQAIQSGAQDFVGKSWMTPESLTRAVENAVSRWRTARNLATQLAAVEILATSGNENEQLADSLNLLAEQTNWQAGAVWLVDEAKDVLKCHFIWEHPSQMQHLANLGWLNRKVKRNEGLAGYVWTNMTCCWWNQNGLEKDEVIEPVDMHCLVEAGFSSACAFAIQNRGECLGVIELYRNSFTRPDEELTHVYEAIGNQIGIMVKRARAEKNLRENEEQLRRSLRYYDFFIAVLGHDLRSPLSAILNSAELGLRFVDEEKTRQLLQRIKSSSQRMQRLIDQLLDVTRIRAAGGLTLQHGPADLRALVENVIDEMTALFGDAHIDLQISGNTNGEWDADRLGQVFTNLIGNAAQHAAGSRHIDIRLSNPNPETIEFCIHNEGVIPPDVLPTLFDPFVKAAGTNRHPGLGLGLYISQQIVLAHGGHICVHSTAETGTTFRMTLPKHPSKRCTPATNTTPPENPSIMRDIDR